MVTQEMIDDCAERDLNIIPVEFKEGSEVIVRSHITGSNWALFAYEASSGMAPALTPLYGEEFGFLCEKSQLAIYINGEKYVAKLRIVDFVRNMPIGDKLHIIEVFRPFAIVCTHSHNQRSVTTIVGETRSDINEGNVDVSHSHCYDGYIDEATYARLCDLNII